MVSKNKLLALIFATLSACATTGPHGFSGAMRAVASMGITPMRVQPQMNLALAYRRPRWQFGVTVEGILQVFTDIPGISHPVALEGTQFGIETCRMWRFFHACGGPTFGFRYGLINEGTTGRGLLQSPSEPHVTANSRIGTHIFLGRNPSDRRGGAYLELGLAGGVNITRTVLTYEGLEIWVQPWGFGQLYFGLRADIYP